MKKVLSVVLAIAMMSALAIPAFAADIEAVDDSKAQDITLTVANTDEESDVVVYSVDVAWGQVAFTYNITTTYDWNPATHEYNANPSYEYAWAGEGNTGVITVTNHTNKALTASAASEVKNASAFTVSCGQAASLATAVNTEVAKAPTDTISYTVNAPETKPTAEASATVIATITVTIADAA